MSVTAGLVVVSANLLACGGGHDASPWTSECTRKMEALGFKKDTPLGQAEIRNCEGVLARRDRSTAD